ncbi:histidine phosphatase family protein [Cyanobacterium sp. Dongsha4]|uniref:histidine phosphatase family protein n=1 Tax=Cyanobacterium sp. DS4 TaxID=2878255 RepID=UPI002E814589|nr:histidine phosphatase family protein [Cyanobacterium sp. Dongsha4]WVK99060.1 histidine phosphatase family protein [Cyanobacterium sp. Dongsha4]
MNKKELMSSTLYLVRHGNRLDFVYPEWFNTAPRKYDPPLSEDGKIQAQQLAQRLIKEKIDYIVSSPFLRAIQTAHIVAENLDLTIKLEAGLGEWHNQDWMSYPPEIHPREELEEVYPRIDWNYSSLLTPIYPESETEMLTRMKKTGELLVNNFQGNLLLIGHSMTVLGITNGLLRENRAIKASVCSLTKIVNREGHWQLELETETSFLSEFDIKLSDGGGE